MKKIVLALILVATPAYAEEQRFEGRKSIEDFWQSKGAVPHVAAGIADNVARESAFDPARPGDGGSSFGLYQHHAERMRTLLARVENDQAFSDVMGDDPIASAHWSEIKAAPTRREAARLWAKYFERCKECGGSNQAVPAGLLEAKKRAALPAPSNPFSAPARTMPEMVFLAAKR